METRKKNLQVLPGFFENIATVTVNPTQGLLIDPKSVTPILNQLMVHGRTDGGRLVSPNQLWSEFEGREFLGVKELEKSLYAIPRRRTFGQIINQAKMCDVYQQFDWLTAMMLGLSMLRENLIPTGTSAMIFLSTQKIIHSNECKMLFSRKSNGDLHVDAQTIYMNIMPSFERFDSIVSIVGRKKNL